VQFPALDPKVAAVGAYVVFMGLNIVGVTIAATFELFVTLLAIFELLVFMGVVAPGFSLANFTKGGWAGADEFSSRRFPASSRPFPSRSGSSLPSRGLPWRPRRPRIRSVPSPLPTRRAF
jgi:ethanolamine permease